MKFDADKIWCGTQETYEAVLSAHEHACELQASGKVLADMGLDPMWHAQGATAVVQINGSLVNGSAGFMRLFGVTGYADIRSALAEAVADKNIKSILLDINSGGGQVAGLSDLGDFIQTVSKVKPVTTFADGAMGSAAYWLGSTGSHLTITDTTIAGSIGALQVHVDRSEQLKKDGLKATIVRSGKYKALGTALEPLSAVAQAEMQSQVDDINTSFVDHVAKMRNTPAAKVESSMGQGRTFMGKRALAAGLVDSVGNYESALKVIADKSSKSGQAGKGNSASMPHNLDNPVKGKSMKVTLTAEQLAAALAAGIELNELESVEPSAEDAAAAVAAAAQAAELAASTAAETAAAAETARLAAEKANEPVANFLRGELKDTQAALTAATVELAEVNRQLAEITVSADALSAIARKSLSTMKVALNESASSVAGMTPAELVAEHTRTSTSFVSKFKVGGVAATASGDPAAEKPTRVLVNPAFAAMIQKPR
jgi:signal peptide peptidase SppA